MDLTTADEIRTWSMVDWVKMGKPAPTVVGDPDPLDIEIERAAVYIEGVTGRNYADIDVPPSNDATRYDEAIQLRVEQKVLQAQKGYLSDLHNDAVDLTVTGYATDRIAAAERTPKNMINAAPRLNELLWELCTDEKRAEWLEEFGLVDVDAAIAITYPYW